MSVSRNVEITTTSLPLNVLVSDGRTGLTGLVAVRDSVTGDRWLDFSDLTFKSSGWSTRQAFLAEVSVANAPGLYHLSGGLDISSVTNLPSAGSELIAEFEVTGTTPIFNAFAIDTFVLVVNISDIPTSEVVADAVWDEDMTTHTSPNSAGLELQGKAEPGDIMSISAAQMEGIADVILDKALSGHFILDSVGEALTLIRGLVQQNYMVDSTTFNVAGLMTAARFRIFENGTQTDGATDGGSAEGEIATFKVVATSEPADTGKLKSYKVSRT